MTYGQKKLRDKILKLGRLLSKDEAFDIYTDSVMTTSRACLILYDNGKYSNGQRDYDMYELEAKAANWHRVALGSLMLQGEIGLWVSDES